MEPSMSSDFCGPVGFPLRIAGEVDKEALTGVAVGVEFTDEAEVVPTVGEAATFERLGATSSGLTGPLS